MPTMRERNAGPPKRLVIRIAIAAGFILAAYLTAAHFSARERGRSDAAQTLIEALQNDRADIALRDGVAALHDFNASPDLSRAVWAALMAGGGKHGPNAMRKWSFAYVPNDPQFRLMFSKDGRFLAAIDGN